MPKYEYDYLEVSCLDRKIYHPTQLRAAVEHLKTIEQGRFVGILVKVHVRVRQYRLYAGAFLQLEQIVGKKPSEVWREFDRQVNRQVSYFERR